VWGGYVALRAFACTGFEAWQTDTIGGWQGVAFGEQRGFIMRFCIPTFMADRYTSTPQSMRCRSKLDIADSVARSGRLATTINTVTKCLDSLKEWPPESINHPAETSQHSFKSAHMGLRPPLTVLVVETQHGCVVLLRVPLGIRLALYIYHSALSTSRPSTA